VKLVALLNLFGCMFSFTVSEKPHRGGAASAETRGAIRWLNSSSDPVTDAIIGAALEVHRCLGPGLLESAYSECLAIEFAERGIPFRRQVPLELKYRGRPVPVSYRLDFLVAEQVVVEVKSVERLHFVFHAQLITYLRTGGYSRGLLLNFSEARLRDGIRRIVNGWNGWRRTEPHRGAAEDAETRGE